jgi:23S rRNA (guanosine2251-2'-O)-methyltransferase
MTDEVARALAPRLEALRSGLDRYEAAERTDLDALLPEGAVHQGVALLAGPLPDTTIEDLCRSAETVSRVVVVALDQANDPHNVGAVLRSAAAFGALAVVLPRDHAPPIGGTLAKAASGALERLPLVRVTNLARALDALKEAGFWCLGLDAQAPETLAEAAAKGRMAGKTVLVLGSEGAGLRRLTRESCDFLARIPIAGAMESLNLSNAAAIALYEASRMVGESSGT